MKNAPALHYLWIQEGPVLPAEKWGFKALIRNGNHSPQFSKPALHHLSYTCPLDERFQNGLKTLFQQQDSQGILYESVSAHRSFIQHPEAEWLTWSELVLKELTLVEQLNPGKPVLFFLPPTSHLDKWLQAFSQLCLYAGPHTSLAFSANQEGLAADYSPPHPVWEWIQHQKMAIETPLLPILNLGQSQAGEGSWPTFPLDILERYRMRITAHHRFGSISMIPHYPQDSTLLEGVLSIAACSLISGQPPHPLIEAWCKETFPHPSAFELTSAMLEARAIALHWQEWKSAQNTDPEIKRLQGETILNRVMLLAPRFNVNGLKEAYETFAGAIKTKAF